MLYVWQKCAAHSFQLEMESEVMGEAVDLTNDQELIDVGCQSGG